MARWGLLIVTSASFCAVSAAAFSQSTILQTPIIQPSPVQTPAIPAPTVSAPTSQPPVLSGGRGVFSVSDCAAPIALRFLAQGKPSAVRSGDVAPRPAASPPGWTIEWDKPAATDTAIGEYASAGHIKEGCPAPGFYSVPVTVYGDEQSSGPLTLTLVRVADPVLDIPASVTLSAERSWDAATPVPLLLRETVTGAPDTRVSILGGELKTAAGEATGIALEPTTATVIVKAGESARVMLAPTEPPAPGAYTARLGVTGTAVKPGATVDVTYKVRIASYWLLVVLALGIALGLLVNVYLAARATLDAALLTGLRAMQSLARRATPQRDPAVQQRLLAVANLLQTSIEDASTAQDVTARVGEAEAQAKEIENKAVEAAASLLQALAATRVMFRPNGHELDAMLATRLADPLGALDQLQRAADAGDVEQTTARLQDYTRDLPTQVVPIVRDFLVDAQTELQALGPLSPGSAIATRRDALHGAIAEAYDAQDPVVLIKSADQIATHLRAWMDMVAPDALSAVWRQAADVLRGSPLAQRLDFAADQADQLRRTGRDPLDRLQALGTIDKTVVAAMSDAAVAVADAAVANALAQGDFVGAAHHLAGQLVDAMQVQDLVEVSVPILDGALAPAGPIAVLRVKPLVPLNQDSMVVVRWMAAPPPPERVTWQCQPAASATLQPGPAGVLVRPSEAGFLTIFLEVAGVRVAEARTYAGEVSEQGIYTVAMREGRFARIGITAATALLTAFAGYEIFVPGWFGTFGDFFAAFLWGFFGQFGLDRIRDLAKPLLSKPLPG